uniref:G-protein coupled receptors family 1 profile domain-containing protein n=1 Tax=Panagrolaimus sp. PS1159 TaxID=55785 RepID=A0AC35GPP1_9BILA
MLPHSLAVFKYFSHNPTFRYYYYATRQELSAFANWSSAAAIWFIFAVTVERFLVIRSPLRSRIYWKKSERLFVLALIFTATGLLTMYHFFEYDCRLVSFCNNTQLYNYCYSAGNFRHPGTWDKGNITVFTSPWRTHYIRISTVCNAIFVVFIPIMAVGILNMLLIRQLQTHDRFVSKTGNSNMQMTLSCQHRQKRRATITVILISSCFALTQGPSAVMSVWELLIGYSSKDSSLFVFMSIANALVVTGKTINFMLFCLSSTHFRRKCAMIFFRKFPRLSQTSFGRQLSGRLSGSKNFHGSMASFHSQKRLSDRRNSSINRGVNGGGSKRFCSQLQPLAEASGNSVEENAAENVQSL